MDISGIGAKLAKKLATVGVDSPQTLIAADMDALAQALGLSVETVRRWQINARALEEDAG